MEQLRKKAAKGFLLEPTIAAEKQPDHREPKTVKELTLRDKLAMERAKTVKDPDPAYRRESQKAFDNFVRQVNNVFFAKPLTYATEQDKCQYVGGFLRGIPINDWEAYNHQNLKMDDPQYAYAELKLMLQERLLPRHIWQVNVTMKLKLLF